MNSKGPPPAALDASPLSHPPGLYLLFVVEMWERFSYYGMRALLVLYLIRSMSDVDNPGRGWTQGEAGLLYGWYTGLAYLLPLMGGFVADRFLGTHRSMLVGGVVIALGHIVLGITGFGGLGTSQLGMSVFIFGLALIIIGTGFFKPCVSVMVGQLYTRQDPRRDGAYTIFYMGVNLGAFLCAFVCGTLGEKVGWHWGFGSAAVGMIAGLLVYLAYRPKYLEGIGLPPEGQSNTMPLFLLLTLLISALAALLYHSGWFGYLAGQIPDWAKIAFGIAALATTVWFIAIQEPGDKGPTTAIFIFVLFNAFFWIAYEQAGSTLNVFAEQSTDRDLFAWEVPATWFQSVNPCLIILLAPLFAWMWTYLSQRKLDPSQPVKIGLGLLLLGIGYVFMVFAAMFNAEGTKVAMFWLLATYLFHTLGELCISPTGLSFVNKTAPIKYLSLLVGVYYISNFVANLGGGYLASKVEAIEKGEIEMFWYRWFKLGGRADYFLMFVISSVGAGLVILLFTPLLKKLLRSRESA